MPFASFDYQFYRSAIIKQIIVFVYNELTVWRDNPHYISQPQEVVLNSDLSKFLTVRAHKCEFGVVFNNQEPQDGRFSIDLSVTYDEEERYDEVITVFECKRLPLPEKNRKDEYVIGYKKPTGGIQRIKLEKHGKYHDVIGMIGFVQENIFQYWQDTINNCIKRISSTLYARERYWTDQEILQEIEHDQFGRKYHGISIHPRITMEDIVIHHLWIQL